YDSDLAAIAKQLPALRDTAAPSTDPEAAKAQIAEDAAAFQAVQQANVRAQALQAQLDNEISAELTDEQRALHQAALAAIAGDASAATATAHTANSGQSLATSSISPSYNSNYNSTYCYNAAGYSAYAHYYSYFAQLYAYYNYSYNTNGSYNA